MCVSPQCADEAIIFVYQRLKHTRETIPAFLLEGLDAKKKYILKKMPNDGTKCSVYGGDELMTRGMIVKFSHDFEGHLYYACEVEKYQGMFSSLAVVPASK
jgi:hypothetical protein